jgi:thioredoxin reductase (NADPH)
VRGVFASGDVRSGSVKRVGAAIGEGAVVGAELHVARADGAAESSGDADSGTGSVGAMGMRLNPHCTPERAHQEVDTISDT